MNRGQARLRVERGAHLAEAYSRRPLNRAQEAETVSEWIRRTGQQPERLNPWDVSTHNRLKGRYA